jgi:hypothetical protein
MTRDLDLTLGDVPYDAMRRLLDDWRMKTPHLKVLFQLSQLMVTREVEAGDQLDQAEKLVLAREYRPFSHSQSPVFQKAWQTHFDEEAAAQSGRDVYPACIVLMASYTLGRFKDDIECTRRGFVLLSYQIASRSPCCRTRRPIWL